MSDELSEEDANQAVVFALTFALEFLGADGEQTLDEVGKRHLGHMRVLLDRWHEQGTWGLGGDS